MRRTILLHFLSLCTHLLVGAVSILGSARPTSLATPSSSSSTARAAVIRSTVTEIAPASSKGDAISPEEPLHVLIAGGGVGGLILANCLELSDAPVTYTILERTQSFKKFGGPIQLASNAMQCFREIDPELYSEIESYATWTGNRTNGIKDGVRDEWYAKFDLKTPAQVRSMPFTCVVDRPDLQDVLLTRTKQNLLNDAAVVDYAKADDGHLEVKLQNGNVVHGDVLIGADGIWSNVRAKMRDEPAKGTGSGVTYSGYTVFAGELDYGGGDPECGYKVYIGPLQYFVITDIGNGRYQWYAFLARAEGSEASEPKPEGKSAYLQKLFDGTVYGDTWSPEILDILKATQEHEIEQRDLYDRPPSVLKPWTSGKVALLGDAVHAMMPNLGQGGCQALEDAFVLSELLTKMKRRSDTESVLVEYRNRRLARSAAVQGLSRLASDIIIKGFDTPCKFVTEPSPRLENFNYAGVVTRLLQPVLPIFFSVQFNFLYSGWKNERFALEPIRDFFLLGPTIVGGALLVDGLLGGEAAEVVTAWFSEQSSTISEFVQTISQNSPF